MTPAADRLSAYSPYALAVLRITSGLLFLAHCTQKFLSLPGGSGQGADLPWTTQARSPA